MQEPAHLAGCALRPDYLQYLIFWTRPGRIGWEVTITWSPDGIDTVRQYFHYDHYHERPTIVAVLCVTNN